MYENVRVPPSGLHTHATDSLHSIFRAVKENITRVTGVYKSAYTHMCRPTSFFSFLNWEGAEYWPKIRPRKIPGFRILLI